MTSSARLPPTVLVSAVPFLLFLIATLVFDVPLQADWLWSSLSSGFQRHNGGQNGHQEGGAGAVVERDKLARKSTSSGQSRSQGRTHREDQNELEKLPQRRRRQEQNARTVWTGPPPPYYFVKAVGDGSIAARLTRDTNFPSVIRVPPWIPLSLKAHPTAKYYMYYSSHGSENYVAMSWAAQIEGPWTPYDSNAGPFNIDGKLVRTRGVMDFEADADRFDWDHVASPEVVIEGRTFVMYFHGENGPDLTRDPNAPRRDGAPIYHFGFIATSRTGLNFNGPKAGNEPGHGPILVTDDGLTSELCANPSYARIFHRRRPRPDGSVEVDGPYAMSKRGQITRPLDFNKPFAPLAANTKLNLRTDLDVAMSKPSTLGPLNCSWVYDYDAATGRYLPLNPLDLTEDINTLPMVRFLASQEFAEHPNNPHPGVRITQASLGSRVARLNHVAVSHLNDGTSRLEVFFGIKSSRTLFFGIYRLILDISDDDMYQWDVSRNPDSGLVYFDEVLKPKRARKIVENVLVRARGEPIETLRNPENYALDIVQFGDPYIFTDEGEKYIFVSYSMENPVGFISNGEGEGQIVAFLLREDASQINPALIESTASPQPTLVPSRSPAPSARPTESPQPSSAPSVSPVPSQLPTLSSRPTIVPSKSPAPSQGPTISSMPSLGPTVSSMPSLGPTVSSVPSLGPTISEMPSVLPTVSAPPSKRPSLPRGTLQLSAASSYRAKAVGNGGIIAGRDGEGDFSFPSLLRIPKSIPPESRADPTAQYYLYYTPVGEMYIGMKWAAFLRGPWTTFNLEAGPFSVHNETTRGVMDFGADVDRNDWLRLGSPDVHFVDGMFVMYFRGRSGPSDPAEQRGIKDRRSFVATSATGLNFNGPAAGGEPGHGPVTVTFDGITTGLCVTGPFTRVFYRQRDGPFAISIWGELSRPVEFSNPLAPLPPPVKKKSPSPLECAWIRGYKTPTATWRKSDARDVLLDDISPIATFLASKEFASHRKNPHPGSIITPRTTQSGNKATFEIGRVAIVPRDDDSRTEVFFSVLSRKHKFYRDTYRLIMDFSSDDMGEWDVARDRKTGEVLFDVVLTPKRARKTVQKEVAGNGTPAKKADRYALNVKRLGDPYVYVLGDRTYLAVSYSDTTKQDGTRKITLFRLQPR